MNIIFIALLVAVAWLVYAYNDLVRLKNRAKEAHSDIDVQLKRRYDLIPNLVEAAKGYMTHEASVFQKVTEARTAAMSAGSGNAKAAAEDMLSGALKSLFAVAENYPQLKASENFAKLQDELSDTENKLQASRRFYNGSVRDFNTRIQIFPTNLIAKQLGFTAVEFFGIDNDAERQNVAVKF